MHRIVTFKIDEELLEILDEYAKRKGASRSEVIREAIASLLRSEGYELPRRRKNNLVKNTRAPIIEIVV